MSSNAEKKKPTGDFRQDSNFLMGYFSQTETGLQYRYDAERLCIEAWGENALRVRATKEPQMPQEDWALSQPVPVSHPVIQIHQYSAEITNGKITAEINHIGQITFRNDKGTVLLREYLRNRRDMFSDTTSSLEVEAREFKPLIGGDYKLTMRFVGNREEKIFGMGQYQQNFLDLQGAELELAHRNSQASVPFYISSLGYGFLWNNPAIGKVNFNRNIYSWEAESTKKLDYWIVADESPAKIEERYASVSGTVPMMPEYGLGFWQCKLRYQTQEELLEVAREYKSRGIPLDVIVVDFFHWPKQGDWRFDPDYWPDPDAMIRELKEMNIELMVSVWPMVDYKSENFEEMMAEGLLTRVEKGVRIDNTYQGNTIQFDPTNPEARAYVWDKCKKNYYDKGVHIFWLDEAEPEYTVYDFENYRYFLGPNVQIGNIYPVMYAKTFFDGMRAAGQDQVVNLLRCAWAGSQKYGALVWSGDIQSSFASLQNQFCAGLNMAIAGIPWWTTDIGGFFGASVEDISYRELFVRWFEYGTFCPVMRLHGYRMPYQPQHGTTGGAACVSGAPNEIWSYGEEVYEICKDYIALREQMRPYIREQMRAAHEKGDPIMRPLFYDFPEDKTAWSNEKEFMFGPDVLVAPVMERGEKTKAVYLPAGSSWTNIWNGEKLDGGQTIEVETPLEQIPVFTRNGYQITVKG